MGVCNQWLLIWGSCPWLEIMQMGPGPGWLKSVVWDYFTNKDMLLIAFKGILVLDFVKPLVL